MKRAILLILALVVSSSALAATSEFRVLLDLDNNQTTGCTSNAFNGAELLIVTKVETTAPAHVTSVTRSTCSGGSFGTAVEENPGGWGVSYNPTTGQGVLETALSISNLTVPIRIGYAIGSQAAVVVTYDGPHDRRRSVGRPHQGPPIILDGNTQDWAGISPISTSAGGTFYVLETSNTFFFRFDGRLVAGPRANDDTFAARQGQIANILAPGVLGNDVEPSGGPMTATLLTQPTHGSVFMQPDGSFTYSHNGSTALSDSFTYRASSAGGTSDPATVTMSIALNLPPTAVGDSYTTTEGGTLTVPAATGVLTNDNDPDTPKSAWSVSVVTRPANGNVSLNSDGSFTYTHNGSETTTDSFRYAIGDGFSVATALVTITITPVNDPPTAVADAYTTAEDTLLSILAPGVLGNDTDPDNANRTAALVTNATNGNVVLNADGSFTYNPNANFFGTDSFTYNANDGALNSTTPATVTITVTPVNDPPSFTSGTNVTVLEDSAAYSAPWATAISSGPNESDALAFVVTNDNNALFSAQPAISPTGVLTFTPAANANGAANVTVVLGDGSAATPAVFFTITVTPVNDVPSFTKGADQVVADTAGPQTVAGWATNLSAGPANEAAQALNFIAGNNNNVLFSTQPAIAPNGTLTFTPAVGQFGVATVTVQVQDNGGVANGGVDTSAAQTFTITVQRAPTITSANSTTFAIGVAGSFTVTTNGLPTAAITETGALPAGITLIDNGNGTATLGGTAAAGTNGSYPITLNATNSVGTGTQLFTITVVCPTITVTNPAAATGVASTPFSQTFTQNGGVGAITFTTASALPTGLTLAADGTLSGTPTQTGTFPITVTATDVNGCAGTGATYNLVLGCQTIAVTNPATTSGTVSSPFSQTFNQSGAIGSATFTTASTLPAGFALSTVGVLSGTPTQMGTFPITVTVTDGNSCTGASAVYNLVIGCQTIAITNPANATGPAGTPFSETFTQTGAIGTATFTTASTLPSGLTLAANGTLSGTPGQGGAFSIVVTVTDSNGCTGSGPTYNLLITCPVITVTNPATSTGTAGSAFNQTFTQSGGFGAPTFSTASSLPAGLTLAANGTLSGTPTVVGTFNIVVTVTDSNGCTGSGATYALVIGCQAITVGNPATTTGTANTPFSQTFTQSGSIGTPAFTTSSTLPAGLSLAANGTLSGTPTVAGSFNIVVTVTDANGCTGTGATYTLVLGCQIITVNNPATTTGAIGAAFNQTFTTSNAVGAVTFATASALPNGLTFASNGTLSGTPTVMGTFPITVTVTDANGCPGTGANYNLVIGCQTITVGSPANNTGTVGTPFSGTFTQSGALGGATFTTASALPTGVTLAANGTLSGTPTQSGTFNITVLVTDGNSCTGTSAAYSLIISCQTITVTNPANANGIVSVAFSELFTQTGGIGATTFSTSSTLPTGFTLMSDGTLAGTTTQTGTFPITVIATDSNGCTGTSATFNLVIACQTITVTNPANANGTAGALFSETFTATGILGTVTWSVTGTLPTGILLNPTSGVLSGTTTQAGTFPIVVRATDTNGCFDDGATYNLVIACQTITVTSPATTTGTAGVVFNQTFTATGILGTATWSVSGTLPTGITLNTSNGALSGTPTQTGTFLITVRATDTNGCFDDSATYTLVIACPAITVTRTGGGTFPNALFNTAYVGQSVTATGSNGTPYTFAVTVGAVPTGLTLNSDGTITGTPTTTGIFTFTAQATDQFGCTGSQAFTINVAPVAVDDAYNSPNAVGNTQALGGGFTPAPTTPLVTYAGNLLTNDSGPGLSTAAVTNSNASGSITFNATGGWVYTPAVGFTGTANLPYTVSSNGVSNTANVIITVSNRVWYVRNNAGAGIGQSQSPFNTLVAAQSASANGDIIFVYRGDGTTLNQSTGILLKTNQLLLGEGVGLTVNTVPLVPAGLRPVISNTAGNGIQMVSGNTVQGLNVTALTGGNGIAASTGTGSGSISNVDITANAVVGNAALNVLSGGVFSFNGNITLTNGSMAGILAGGSGTGALTFSGNVTNNGSVGRSVLISGNSGTATVTINSTISDNGGGIEVSNSASGTITFNSSPTISTTSNQGVRLFTNGTATINFSGGTLGITTTSGFGFDASVGGTVNVTGSANTISSGTGTALRVQNTTIGVNDITFRSISANGSANGIVLDNTGATGNLIVTGTGGAGSGGVIQNTTGHGISLTNTTAPSFTSMTIQNIGRNGIDGQQVVGFTLANSTINNVGTASAGQYDENNIAFNDGGAFTTATLTGAVSITGNTLTNARRHGIQIELGSGTISSLTIQNNTLTSSTSAAVSLGTAVLVLAQGSAATASHITTGTISGNTINNFPSGEGIAILGGTGNATNNTSTTLGANGTPISITGNFVDGGATRMGSNAIRASFNGQFGISNFTISNNGTPALPITNIQGQGISVFMGGSVTGTTTINNNRIVANQTLLAGTQGLAVQVDDGPAGLGTSAADYNVIITNNNVSAYEGNGIRAIARASLGKMDVTIQNNTVGTPIMANRNGIRVDAGSAAGDVTLCMNMTNNTSAGSGLNLGIGLRKQGTVATVNDFGIVGLVPSPALAAVAAVKVVTDNPAGGGVDIINGDNFVSCTTTP